MSNKLVHSLTIALKPSAQSTNSLHSFGLRKNIKTWELGASSIHVSTRFSPSMFYHFEVVVFAPRVVFSSLDCVLYYTSISGSRERLNTLDGNPHLHQQQETSILIFKNKEIYLQRCSMSDRQIWTVSKGSLTDSLIQCFCFCRMNFCLYYYL